jgi:hypothetical protein
MSGLNELAKLNDEHVARVRQWHRMQQSGRLRKPQPARRVNRHVAVNIGDGPGNRCTVLAPAECFPAFA